MTLIEDIIESFRLDSLKLISDNQIEENPDAWTWHTVDNFIYIPNYMIWCLKYGESNGNLVCDYTLMYIAELGRVSIRHKETKGTNFKFLCSKKQKEVIVKFLYWCLENLNDIDDVRLKRTLPYWERKR